VQYAYETGTYLQSLIFLNVPNSSTIMEKIQSLFKTGLLKVFNSVHFYLICIFEDWNVMIMQ
jgi:hypothetical protein